MSTLKRYTIDPVGSLICPTCTYANAETFDVMEGGGWLPLTEMIAAAKAHERQYHAAGLPGRTA